MMKIISLLISFVLIVAPLPSMAQYAPEKIQKDGLQIGKAASLLPKELIFDAGEGASNKKLSLDPSDNQFDLNSTLNITGGLDVTGASSLHGAATLGSTLSVESTSTHKAGVKIGQGVDENKSIIMDRASADSYLKWDETLDKWVFSNDGTLEKPLGSGSGNGSGGINILVNNSYEDGLTPGWTSSGGTFTQQTYTNTVEGDVKYAQFVATTSGQYFESSLTVIPDNLGWGCQAQMQKYATATDSAWKIVVLDSSGNVLSTQNFNQSGGASTFIASPILSFPCPVAGATAKLRIESLAAATIKADLAYLGGNKNTADIAQARLAGESYFAAPSVCQYTRTSTTLGSLSGSSTCVGPTIATSSIGSWQTTDTDSLKQTINNLPPGRYKATFQLATAKSSTTTAASGAITDGTTPCQELRLADSTAHDSISISCVFTYTTQGDRNFEFLARSNSGGVVIDGDSGTGFSSNSRFTLEYFPLDSQTAVTNDQSAWMIDANIGGANISLSTTAVSSYTEITNASLDMVLRDGSSAAKIPCSSTNASTSTTCSAGSEGVGVVFTPPYAGLFDVCASFSSRITTTSGSINAAYQLVETTNSTQTIIQEGGERREFSHALSDVGVPFKLCGTFKFDSVTEKTIRLMYEQSTTNVSAHNLNADRSATVGQRDIRITVRPSTANTSRPVLSGPLKFQTKSTTTSDSSWTIGETIPGIAFSNLIVGKNYRISFRIRGTSTAAAANTCAFDVKNGSTPLTVTGYYNTEDGNHVVSGSLPFTAVASTITFEAISGVSNYQMSSADAWLEELDDYIPTTQW